jgi:archaellum biogenesis protein FlaJ (TadC family)
VEKEEKIEEKEATFDTFIRMLKYTGGKRSMVVPVVIMALQSTIKYYNGRAV